MQQRLLALQQRLLALARAVWTAVLLLFAALRIRRTDDEPPADTPASHAAPPPALASDAPASPALASADAPLHPLALTADEFAAAASARLGAAACSRARCTATTTATARSPPQRELQQAPALAGCARSAPARRHSCSPTAAAPAPGATEKYVLRTRDGYEVEMVRCRRPARRAVVARLVAGGLPAGLRVCETGRLGLRDLSAAEIASQVAHARHCWVSACAPSCTWEWASLWTMWSR